MASTRHRVVTGWATFLYFAAGMLLLLGVFQVMEGVVALAKDDFYLTGRNGMPITVDLTTWGWIHLVLGLLMVGAAIGVVGGKMWGRVIGIALAAVAALANVLFLPAAPFLGATIIGMCVLVIYALTVHGREPASV
jgi:hypothetical protein